MGARILEWGQGGGNHGFQGEGGFFGRGGFDNRITGRRIFWGGREGNGIDEETGMEQGRDMCAVADKIDTPPGWSRMLWVAVLMLAGMALQIWGYNQLSRSFRPWFVETTYRMVTQQEYDSLPPESKWVEVARQNDWNPNKIEITEERPPSKMTLVWQKRAHFFLIGLAGTFLILGTGYWHSRCCKFPLIAVFIGPAAIIPTLRDQ